MKSSVYDVESVWVKIFGSRADSTPLAVTSQNSFTIKPHTDISARVEMTDCPSIMLINWPGSLMAKSKEISGGALNS